LLEFWKSSLIAFQNSWKDNSERHWLGQTIDLSELEATQQRLLEIFSIYASYLELKTLLRFDQYIEPRAFFKLFEHCDYFNLVNPVAWHEALVNFESYLNTYIDPLTQALKTLFDKQQPLTVLMRYKGLFAQKIIQEAFST
jgi:hypothetical protein